MKTALIFADGIKQIVFTPENDEERQALKLFTPNDNIELAVVEASLGGTHVRNPYSPQLAVCQGGWIRLFGEDKQSIMFVLSPKKKES